MKCPQCNGNQRYKDGMTCNSCGYRFALDPKKAPNLSDMAVKKVVDGLSGFGQYAFTYHQLYARIHRLLQKKGKGGRIGCAVGLGIALIILSFPVLSTEAVPPLALILPAALYVFFVVWLVRRPVKVSHSVIADVISRYRAVHAMEGLADGKGIGEKDETDPNPEWLHHAPERILIVQRDDVAEMLIRNGFHLENKTLVVSAHRRPTQAFAAFREFMERYPDIPIAVVHDASKKGHRLKTDLMADPEWGLAGKKVEDLGLHPADVARLKTPVWTPEPGSKNKHVRVKGKPVETIQDGYYMPLDIAGPKALMGSMGLAMVVGAALLSDELLAEQQKGGADGGGFG